MAAIVAAFAGMSARLQFHSRLYLRRPCLWRAITLLPAFPQPCRTRMRDHAHFVQIRLVPVLIRFAACDKNRQLNKGGPAVNLALRRLDVLAVCAVFIFVGAVLLGAF